MCAASTQSWGGGLVEESLGECSASREHLLVVGALLQGCGWPLATTSSLLEEILLLGPEPRSPLALLYFPLQASA